MRNMRAEDVKNMTHYQVPKWLMDMFLAGEITAGGFKTYTLMYDRLRLSIRNGWIDENGEVYIKYSYEELLEDLKANSKTTVSNNIKELERLGLVSKVKCYSSSNIYYLTIYSTENCTSTKDCTSTKNCTPVVQEKCNSVVQKTCTTSSTENLYASKNNYNKNNYNKNNSSSAVETAQPQLDEKSIEFRTDITELRDIIIKATGENPATVDMVFKPVMYREIIKPLLAKIKASKYLLGEKDSKPRLYTFVRQDRINEILAGMYDDFKTEKAKYKVTEVVTTEDLQEKAKREKEQKEFEEMLGL